MLANADLRDANLNGANLQAADLRGADLRGSLLAGADLTDAQLEGARFQQATLDDTTLLAPKWRQVWTIVNSTLKDRNLADADLAQAYLAGAYLRQADLTRANLAGANLRDADLRFAILDEASLQSSDLANASIQEGSLRGADLRGANLLHTDLRLADLRGAQVDDTTQMTEYQRLAFDLAANGGAGRDLRDAYLAWANLAGVDFTGANLAGADLHKANLAGAVLVNADLRGANLTDADLSGADLAGAQMDGAVLKGAQLPAIARSAHAHVRSNHCASGRRAPRACRVTARGGVESRRWMTTEPQRPPADLRADGADDNRWPHERRGRARGRARDSTDIESRHSLNSYRRNKHVYHKTHWTVEKIGRRLELIEHEKLVYRRTAYLPAFQHLVLPDPMTPPPVGASVDRSAWETIRPNSYWGERFSNFILSTTFTVPADWPPELPVGLYLPLGESGDFSHPEALAYIDGVAYATCDRHHQEFLLPAQYRDGKPHRLDLHGWSGLFGSEVEPLIGGLYMKPCMVVEIDQPTRDFVALARVALDTAKQIDDNEVAKGYILNALDAAFKVLDIRTPMSEGFHASVPAAMEALKAGLAEAGPALGVEVIGTGHAHIDVAWLWTLGVTRRKAGRTFHTVLRLMEQFPEYHFTQSQPQLYDYVRQDYPALYEGIKQRVVEGRWEPIGGMWVEADCNLTGPESLARQFLLGRTYFRKHFGADVETPVLWLPDVFGYAWNLPQLIKEAGMEYFFTIKIGWSQYNRLPYDSFWWQGVDGTKVLTHFSTTPDFGAFASTYNADGNAQPKTSAPGPTSSRRSSSTRCSWPSATATAAAGRRARCWKTSGRWRISLVCPKCATVRCMSSTRRWRPKPATNCRRGMASSIWSSTAAPTPPRAATSAQTARASSSSTTRNSWQRWPSWRVPAMSIRGRFSTKPGSWSASTSSTTSSLAARSHRST